MSRVGSYPSQYGQTAGPPVYSPGRKPIPGVYPTNVVVVTQTPYGPRGVGICPICGLGVIRERATFCGILLAIIFFPIGIICCLMTVEKRCSHCNAKI